MKKPFRFSIFIVVLCAIAVVLIAETLIVKVQITNLRKEPKFYAQTVAILKVGDKLEQLGTQGGWVMVRTSSGITGWLHSSSVKPKKFSLLAMDKSLKTQASADEVSLAGKGFTKQVEENYKARHSGISFVWVDKMLMIDIAPKKMKKFLQAGKLGEFGGGR